MSSRHHVFLPPNAPKGLVVYFHGDFAHEYASPQSPTWLGGPDGVAAQACRRGYALIVVRTPDRVEPLTWWENPAVNVAYTEALLRHLRATYDVDRRHLWLVGYSGGAQFLTKYFLPGHSDVITGGGVVLFGGGQAPPGPAGPFSATMRRGVPMFWYTGADDTAANSAYGFDALGAAKSGLAFYGARGFTVGHHWQKGVGHHLDGRFGPVVGARMDAAGA